MKDKVSLWVLLCCAIAVGTITSISAPFSQGGDFCYRPAVVQSYAAPKIVTHYAPTTSHYGGHSYYQKEYVPYAVEVQVNRDRYYSLSDLYRDRLYLEAFDLMREMRSKINGLSASVPPIPPVAVASAPGGQGGGGVPSKGAPGVTPPGGNGTNPPPPVPQKGTFNRTSERVLKLLSSKCVNCHNADTIASEKRPEPLRLDDPDSVPTIQRWASFGMTAAREMPRAPKELREKGKEAELQAWRIEHGLKDDEMKWLFDEWVAVPVLPKK